MYIDKIIKREILTLIVSVIVILCIVIGISFAYFFRIDEGEENAINVGDLEITFCNDNKCSDKYDNYGQVIGTKTVDGVSVPDPIYPFNTAYDALKSTPYIFNIKNTGDLDTYLTIKLVEDKDYVVTNNAYLDYVSTAILYADHMRVGISDCSNGINTKEVEMYVYGEIENNVIKSKDFIRSQDDKTYCLWMWLDDSTPNGAQNTYFVANLDFQAEYIPEDN